MITILHGDDIARSRTELTKLIQQREDALTFDGATITLNDLVQNIEGSGLFNDHKNIFIENFFSKRKAGQEVEDIIAFLNSHESEATIIMWEQKEISQKTLVQFKKLTVTLFKLPQVLFIFLDSIKPHNTTQTLQLFQVACTQLEVDLLFFMTIRHCRLLLALSDKTAKKTIDEVKRMASWQQNKLLKQSSLFTKDSLLGIYKRLHQIDIAHKTGTLGISLKQSLDLLLLEI